MDYKQYLINISKVGFGNVAARSIGFISLPIISRIYEPEQFGELSFVTTLVAIISVFSTLRYSEAIVTEPDSKSAKSLVLLCLSILILVTLVTPLILIFLYPKTNSILLLILTLCVFTKGVFELVMNLTIRAKNFNSITVARIGQNLMASFAKISLGYSSFGHYGLLWGQMVLEGSGIVYLSRKLGVRGERWWVGLTFSDVKKVFEKHRKFLIFQTPSQFLLILNKSLIIFFIFEAFGGDALGQYAFALSMSALPVGFVSSAVADVFYAEVSKLGRENINEVNRLIKFTLKRTLYATIFIIIFQFVFSSYFCFLFGHKWHDASVYILLLLPLIVSRFIVSPLIKVYNVLGWQYWQLRINALRFMLTLIVIFVAFVFGMKIAHLILTYSVVSMIYNFLILGHTLIEVKKLR